MEEILNKLKNEKPEIQNCVNNESLIVIKAFIYYGHLCFHIMYYYIL